MKVVVSLFASLFVCSAVHAAGQDPHWEYQGQVGPQNWADVSDKFFLCREGSNQSPINLVADLDVELPEIDFDYHNAGMLQEENTGHSIMETVRPGNFVRILGGEFELKQFHFHSPSEHTVDGAYYPMEVHFVHQASDGHLLVVGLMFEQGERNELMDQLPSFRQARGEPAAREPFNYNELVIGRSDYFLYNGSLTTPPCSEGVRWIVMKKPIVASAEQIQFIHDLLGFDNNRPIQAHNARIILE